MRNRDAGVRKLREHSDPAAVRQLPSEQTIAGSSVKLLGVFAKQ